MATNHARLPQRTTRMPLRGKADENATSKHLRQQSGSGLPRSSKALQKEVVGVKSNPMRSALGEVTTTAVNLRENNSKVLLGKEKDKDEVSLKRGRSNSTNNAVQRVPLGPGRSQIAPPVTSTAPIRAAPGRLSRSSIVSGPRRSIRDARPIAVYEDVEMDVEEQAEGVVRPSEEPALETVVEAYTDFLTSEPDGHDMAVVGEDEPPETVVIQEPKAPKIWPNLPTQHRLDCERRVETIREVFDDDDDEFDPNMVSEYAGEIFEYMSGLEEMMMPRADYMDSQSELTWDMRATLIDWLLQVHLRYHMLPETLWITINIIDRFLSQRTVSVVKLQLVGITAIFIAAKYEEILAPSVDEFVFMTDEGFKKDEILKGERIILQALDFQISHYCSPYNWMRRISKADDYDLQTRTLSKFLIEVTLIDCRFLRAKASLIAAVGMYSARTMLGGDWNDSFVYYSGYTEDQLYQGHLFIVEKMAERSFSKLALYKKYANKKFLKASTFAVRWSRAHVSGAGGVVENTMLDADLV
ncbi:cyclin-like protein [Lentinula aff. detonsa]|uniref:Cyclin-like protein n=1 Tax=Lentinula aff. detonsa TaxID=2804958 RepID=A0AA38L5A7_9AGAR|nr:cyclin-like protein [Lentinula aff. detonsa]KAJ3801797.1 cyclin-like protein [Lentinula aff. detonsa]